MLLERSSSLSMIPNVDSAVLAGLILLKCLRNSPLVAARDYALCIGALEFALNLDWSGQSQENYGDQYGSNGC